VSTLFERRFSVKTAIDELLPSVEEARRLDILPEERGDELALRARALVRRDTDVGNPLGVEGGPDPATTFKIAFELAEVIDEYRREEPSPQGPVKPLVNLKPKKVAAGTIVVSGHLESNIPMGIGSKSSVLSIRFFKREFGFHRPTQSKSARAALWLYVRERDEFGVEDVDLTIEEMREFSEQYPPQELAQDS